MSECRKQVGPVWKLGGETCTCTKQEGHEMPHECSCGAWFESPELELADDYERNNHQ